MEGNFQSKQLTPFFPTIFKVLLSDHKSGKGADQIFPPNPLSSLLALRDNIRTTLQE